jgi:hypothetical protein
MPAFVTGLVLRKDGRKADPRVRKSSNADPLKSEVLKKLRIGAALLEVGRRPNRRFWNYLAMAMNAEGQWEPDLHFPIKARLFRTDGTKGRDFNPELKIRQRVIEWLLKQELSRGIKYEVAVAEVSTKLRIGAKTVRNAYDPHAKRRGS